MIKTITKGTGTFVMVFAFELLPKEVFDVLYPVLDLHLCRRGD